MPKYSEDFNWKAAEADVEEMGGDLDMLYTRNDKHRDDYLRELELDPKRYVKKSSSQSTGSSSDGCYVATCVYGSYDCPAVWTLRRFRDTQLGTTIIGRAFIYSYYAISPSLVRWFGQNKLFRTICKAQLDQIVTWLNMKGFEDSPYQDHDWRKKHRQ